MRLIYVCVYIERGGAFTTWRKSRERELEIHGGESVFSCGPSTLRWRAREPENRARARDIEKLRASA